MNNVTVTHGSVEITGSHNVASLPKLKSLVGATEMAQ
jgi:hypothetical protein